MSFHVATPSPPLSRFVKQFWAIENCMPIGSEHVQRVVPNGLVQLMFYLGDRPKSLDKTKDIPENTLLCGQQNGYFDMAVSGNLSLFCISFHPHGAMMFFDIPISEVYDQNVPLSYFLKDKVARLETELHQSATFAEKIDIAERFLMSQLFRYNNEYEINRITNSIGLINRSKGMIKIDTLSSAACLSRKQYERKFLESVGTSPKQFLKIVRFQNALHIKQKNRNIQLTDLAFDSGYYDQSHMINAFQSFSGKTPRQYFLECDPISDYFQ